MRCHLPVLGWRGFLSFLRAARPSGEEKVSSFGGTWYFSKANADAMQAA